MLAALSEAELGAGLIDSDARFRALAIEGSVSGPPLWLRGMLAGTQEFAQVGCLGTARQPACAGTGRWSP